MSESKTGRPKIEFDWEEFDKLCELQCTAEEMAGWFKCSVDTIERRVKEKFDQPFAEVFALKRGRGKIALRRKQMQVALSGNTALLIFLGKQYLDQSDKRDDNVKWGVDKAGEKLVIQFADLKKDAE